MKIVDLIPRLRRSIDDNDVEDLQYSDEILEEYLKDAVYNILMLWEHPYELVEVTEEVEIDFDEWEEGNLYEVGDVVLFDGEDYECIVEHTSDEANKPPDETYWGVYEGESNTEEKAFTEFNEEPSPFETTLFLTQARIDLLSKQKNISFRAGDLAVTYKGDAKDSLEEKLRKAIRKKKIIEIKLGRSLTEYDTYSNRIEDWFDKLHI